MSAARAVTRCPIRLRDQRVSELLLQRQWSRLQTPGESATWEWWSVHEHLFGMLDVIGQKFTIFSLFTLLVRSHGAVGTLHAEVIMEVVPGIRPWHICLLAIGGYFRRSPMKRTV